MFGQYAYEKIFYHSSKTNRNHIDILSHIGMSIIKKIGNTNVNKDVEPGMLSSDRTFALYV